MPNNASSSKRQRGQAVVLVALMALALVAFIGLALDGGNLYRWRRVMQDAADGGAIAGAYTMTLGASSAQISSTINQYAVVSNRADAFTYDIQAKCVSVSTTKSFPSLFIGLIGIDNLDTRARATACAGQPTGAGDLWPISIPISNYVVSSTYALSVTNLNWLCFNGGNCGATDLANWIANGFVGTYTQYPDVGSSMCTGPDPGLTQLILPGCLGEKAGQSTLTGQLYPPVCTGQNGNPPAIGRDFTVPLYDLCADPTTGGATPCTTNSNNYFHVVGFGRFTLLGMRFNNGKACYVGIAKEKDIPNCPPGVNDCLWGRFVEYVAFHDICVSGCPTYTGTLSVALIY